MSRHGFASGSKGNDYLKAAFARLARRWGRATPPLAGLRLVVTMPPSQHWHGRDLALARDHATALRSLGATIFEFDTEPFFRSDHSALQRQIAEVRDFGADAAISAPHAKFAAAIRWTGESSDEIDAGNNVFLDLLELPTLLYWDHVLTQAMFMVPFPPSAPADSQGGTVEKLRTLFNHPRAFHFFPDTGHIAELGRLGLGTFDTDNYYVPGVPHEFIEYGERFHWRDGRGGRAAFFGNVCLTAASRIRYAQAELMEIRRDAHDACASDWDLSPLTAYCERIDSLGGDLQSRLQLDLDQTFRWRFLHQEVAEVANGELRLRKLLACRQPVAYFGGFADPESRHVAAAAGLVFEECLPPDTSLAAAFRRTQVSLDVVTAPFINGFSHKLLACFASGGFMLTTRKRDIAASLGGMADTIGYSSGDEVAAKLERYLGSDGERREISGAIATLVRREYSTRAGFARTVPLALARIDKR
jgi:hypothetical protein